MKKLLVIGVVILIIILIPLVYYFVRPEPIENINSDANPLTAQNPTDFAQIGNFSFNAPGLTPGMPYLIYEQPGKPGLSVYLEIDELSVCAVNNTAQPCQTLKDLKALYEGKKVYVEGQSSGLNEITVRKMLAWDGRPLFKPQAGHIFINWDKAKELVQACEVKKIMQTHSLEVTLDLKNGKSFEVIEPKIDDIFQLVNESKGNCGNIIMATE